MENLMYHKIIINYENMKIQKILVTGFALLFISLSVVFTG